MIITNLKKSIRSRQKYDVYVDDECVFSLYESDIKKLNLKISDEITKDKLTDIIETTVKKNALNDALRLISRTDYSSKMLSEKLSERNYPYEVIIKTVDYLSERNYINDYEYAKKFIKSAFSSKKKGKAYVEMELFKRGITAETICVLTEKYYDENEITSISENKIKNIIKGKDKPDFKDYNKLKGYLLRQGFSYDEISNAVNMLKGKYED